MGDRGDLAGVTASARPAAGFTGALGNTPRLVPGIPVIDPWTGQNFQQNGPHTAYFRWLLRQPGDPGRYRPADFHPLIARVRHAQQLVGTDRAGLASRNPARTARRQIEALTLGLCCGWRALDRVQARWLHAWLVSLLACESEGRAQWIGSRAETALTEYCREKEYARPRHNAAVERALRRISAAGMTTIYEDACRLESWRDVEMLLMGAWRSGISLVDEEGFLLPGWRARFALAFAMRFPEIS